MKTGKLNREQYRLKWLESPDRDVIQAATIDKNGYPTEVQNIIQEEVAKRGLAEEVEQQIALLKLLAEKRAKKGIKRHKVALTDRGQSLHFPLRCVCCSGMAETNMFVSYSRSWGFDLRTTHTRGYEVPCCKKCLAHCLRLRYFIYHGIGALASVTFGSIVANRWEENFSAIFFGLFLFWIAGFLVCRGLWYVFIKPSRKFKKCCLDGTPVRFVWEGELFAHHSYFLFRDREYALDFAQSNDLTVEEISIQ